MSSTIKCTVPPLVAFLGNRGKHVFNVHFNDVLSLYNLILSNIFLVTIANLLDRSKLAGILILKNSGKKIKKFKFKLVRARIPFPGPGHPLTRPYKSICMVGVGVTRPYKCISRGG